MDRIKTDSNQYILPNAQNSKGSYSTLNNNTSINIIVNQPFKVRVKKIRASTQVINNNKANNSVNNINYNQNRYINNNNNYNLRSINNNDNYRNNNSLITANKN